MNLTITINMVNILYRPFILLANFMGHLIWLIWLVTNYLTKLVRKLLHNGRDFVV